MLCMLGCPGEVWGSLGANIWGVRVRIPPGLAVTVAGLRGVLTAPGVTVVCNADCINVVGGSALIMCGRALTVTEVDDWPLFTSGGWVPTTDCNVVLVAVTTILFPFRVVVCTGGLTSVTVGPVVWLAGWVETTTLCEFIRGVWMTLFDAGGIIGPGSPLLDNTDPLLTAAGPPLLAPPLVTVPPWGAAALPGSWEFIVWLPLKVCTKYEPTFPWWFGRDVAPPPSTSALPGSHPVVESALAVVESIVEPWGPRCVWWDPQSFNLFGRSTDNLACDVKRLWHFHLLLLSTLAYCFRHKEGEKHKYFTAYLFKQSSWPSNPLDISSRYPLVPELKLCNNRLLRA